MPILSTTAPHAAVLGLGYVYLSTRIGVMRWRLNSYLGEQNVRLRRLVRVHANFAEYVPFALILIAMAESLKAPVQLLHLLGATLVLARVLHAFGVAREPEPIWFRVIGFAVTIIVIAIASCASLYLAVASAMR
jgi:uncharacterized membrane protein YecN with MAPEG domain